MKRQMFGSAMGVLTVAQEGDGWVVLEDGRRVGGTLLVPFASREAAQRYVEKELAAEAETIASGDVAGSATATRHTHMPSYGLLAGRLNCGTIRISRLPGWP